MTVRLVIFDCDGVLFQSEAANIAFYNAVLRLVGEPELDDNGEAACHALSSAQLFEKYYGDRPEFLERVRETARALHYGPFFPMMQPRAGLREVLASLRARYKVAMATNRGKTVRGVLDHFELGAYFDAAVGVLDVARPKPHPDMLFECARRVDVSPQEAVYVGDQASDAESARAARMHFVGMGPVAATSRHSIASLDELQPLLATL